MKQVAPVLVPGDDLRRFRAFTLVELLVVISIIAVLAGLLLPVVNLVQEKARKVQARDTESQIVAAVKNFQTDYSVYPVLNPAAGMDSDFTATTGNAALFKELRPVPGDANSVLNTKLVPYFEASDAKNPTVPKAGFVTVAAVTKNGATTQSLNVGDFVDPWGWTYRVRIDTNYNDVVANPYSTPVSGDNPTAPSSDTTQIRTPVIAWSVGSNGIQDDGTKQLVDDVDSWQ